MSYTIAQITTTIKYQKLSKKFTTMISGADNGKLHQDSSNADEALVALLTHSNSSFAVASSSCSYPSVPRSFFDPFDDPSMEPRPIRAPVSNKDRTSRFQPQERVSESLPSLFNRDEHSSSSIATAEEATAGNELGQLLFANMDPLSDIIEPRRIVDDFSLSNNNDQLLCHTVDDNEMSCDLFLSDFRREVADIPFSGWWSNTETMP